MVELRDARAADAAELSALALRSKAHWGYDDAFLEAVRAELTWTADDLAASLVRVAERDGRIAGFSVVRGHAPDAELDALFVDEPHIGSGLGGALLEDALAHARVAGIRALILDADPGAEGFYAHHGAVRIGETPSGSIPGRTLPRMRFDLTAPQRGSDKTRNG